MALRRVPKKYTWIYVYHMHVLEMIMKMVRICSQVLIRSPATYFQRKLTDLHMQL